jgi:ABC-type antimicrobial peptide transport system permease subunit
MVMREVLVLISVGVTVGVPMALAFSGIVRSQLFGLDPHDPLTLVASIFTLGVAACAAGFIPALRASRIDPMQALRTE